MNKQFTASHQLPEVGFEVNDTWLASLLMKGLPKQYEPMILGLESSGMKLTTGIVKAKIIQDVKFRSDCKLSHPRSKQKSGEKFEVKCFRCKKHLESQC